MPLVRQQYCYLFMWILISAIVQDLVKLHPGSRPRKKATFHYRTLRGSAHYLNVYNYIVSPQITKRHCRKQFCLASYFIYGSLVNGGGSTFLLQNFCKFILKMQPPCAPGVRPGSKIIINSSSSYIASKAFALQV